MATEDAHTYRDLVDAAYVRGWDDGSFAAPFEPRGPGHLTSPVAVGSPAGGAARRSRPQLVRTASPVGPAGR